MRLAETKARPLMVQRSPDVGRICEFSEYPCEPGNNMACEMIAQKVEEKTAQRYIKLRLLD